VDEALENLKAVGTIYVEANKSSLRSLFSEILHMIDLVELRRNLNKQIEAPREL